MLDYVYNCKCMILNNLPKGHLIPDMDFQLLEIEILSCVLHHYFTVRVHTILKNKNREFKKSSQFIDFENEG